MRSHPAWSRAALAMTACLALAACHNPTETSDGVEIGIAVDRSDIEPELPAHITVSITNHGAEAVKLADQTCVPKYVVRNVFKGDVPVPGRVCILVSFAPRDLAPGQTVVLMDQWAGETDNASRTEMVPSGRYEILARVYVDGHERRSAPAAVQVH